MDASFPAHAVFRDTVAVRAFEDEDDEDVPFIVQCSIVRCSRSRRLYGTSTRMRRHPNRGWTECTLHAVE